MIFEITERSRTILGQIIHAEQIERQLVADHQEVSRELADHDRRTILAVVERRGRAKLIEDETDPTRQGATKLISLQSKISACRRLMVELREKLRIQLDMDRQAAIAGLSDRIKNLKDEDGQLKNEYIALLARTKILEIKFRRWHNVWNRKEPGIGPQETALWASFHAEVERLCKEEGLDSSWVSPVDGIKQLKPTIEALRKPIGPDDIDELLKVAKREATQSIMSSPEDAEMESGEVVLSPPR
jgi:hypothetical protein